MVGRAGNVNVKDAVEKEELNDGGAGERSLAPFNCGGVHGGIVDSDRGHVWLASGVTSSLLDMFWTADNTLLVRFIVRRAWVWVLRPEGLIGSLEGGLSWIGPSPIVALLYLLRVALCFHYLVSCESNFNANILLRFDLEQSVLCALSTISS
jgi:hypothetical protein